jgi:hypothetical protein
MFIILYPSGGRLKASIVSDRSRNRFTNFIPNIAVQYSFPRETERMSEVAQSLRVCYSCNNSQGDWAKWLFL